MNEQQSVSVWSINFHLKHGSTLVLATCSLTYLQTYPTNLFLFQLKQEMQILIVRYANIYHNSP